MSDIEDLFNLDPLELRKDRDKLRQIIQYYRDKRSQFTLTTQKKKEKKESKLSIAAKLDFT